MASNNNNDHIPVREGLNISAKGKADMLTKARNCVEANKKKRVLWFYFKIIEICALTKVLFECTVCGKQYKYDVI
jgi:hypothetical protein